MTRPAGPLGLTEHAITEANLEDACRLSAEHGWNQIAADWRLMIEPGLSRGLTTPEGRMVASVLALPFGDRFAWIAMMLVAGNYQRAGAASHLMRWIVSTLRARDLTPGLDATPQGRPVYLRLGFKQVYTMTRLLADAGQLAPAAPKPVPVRPMQAADLRAAALYDRPIFGADRSYVLANLFNRLPEAAFVAEDGARLVGYVLGRDGRMRSQIGPLVADRLEIARGLAGRALAAAGATLCIDVPDHQSGLIDWFSDLGFQPAVRYVRMIHERAEPLDDPDRIFAVAGPELG